jgi:hypothetical protein
MISIGLMPSSTGRIGGKRVGQKMADYPMKGGLFLDVCKELFADDYNVSWYDRAYPKNTTEASMLNNFNFAQMLCEDLPAHALQVQRLDLDAAMTAQNNQIIGQAGGSQSSTTNSGVEAKPKPLAKSKVKYTCNTDTCKTNVWGKGGMSILCGVCNEPYEQEKDDD